MNSRRQWLKSLVCAVALATLPEIMRRPVLPRPYWAERIVITFADGSGKLEFCGHLDLFMQNIPVTGPNQYRYDKAILL